MFSHKFRTIFHGKKYHNIYFGFTRNAHSVKESEKRKIYRTGKLQKRYFFSGPTTKA